MTNKIIEASELPESEKVYLRKDFLGWRVVEPVVHPETNKIVWKNIFNKRGFILLGVILLVIGLFYMAYGEQIQNFKQVMDNPCEYCIDCHDQTLRFINQYGDKYNVPELNISKIELLK